MTADELDLPEELRASEGSDVDLLVVAETEDRVALEVLLEDAVEAAVGAHKVDLIVIPAEAWHRARRLIGFVTYEADRHGVPVYERAA